MNIVEFYIIKFCYFWNVKNCDKSVKKNGWYEGNKMNEREGVYFNFMNKQ